MSVIRSSLFLLMLVLGLPLRAAQQCLVIGDSLTKEYEVEFPLLFPQNPASWDSRNWAEILHERRNTWFDLGNFSGYADSRATGHEYNWAIPGATTGEIKNLLRNFGFLLEISSQIRSGAERVVIFAGGNDVDSYYRQIYDGQSPTSFTRSTRDNLQWLVDYVRGLKSSLPIVLVSVPHLGCAPDVQAQCPTDPVKTARVTAALDDLNAQLATFAQTRGIAFVPGVYQLTKDMISLPFRIGGIEFYRQADADSRPRYAFSGDGFHPAVSPQAKIAQMIIDAFVSRYPTTKITALSDREIIEQILGLNSDLPFQEWMATQDVPENQRGVEDDPDGDGLINLIEFVRADGNAAQATSVAWPTPRVDRSQSPSQVVWTVPMRPESIGWATARFMQSSDLVSWQTMNASQVTISSEGAQTVRFPLSPRTFVRLEISR